MKFAIIAPRSLHVALSIPRRYCSVKSDRLLEQNLIDLGWHQEEFQQRRSFAYTVVAPDESQVVGCIYLYPTRKRGYDAEAYLWARQSSLVDGLETHIHSTVKDWLATEWPFSNVAFPVRIL